MPPPRERSRISVVREQPGAARVDGVGPIRGFAKGRDCTFMHCLELVLEAVGRKTGYDELMGLSGMAFRTQFRVDRWDVGNPDPLVGENCIDPVFSAIGWKYEVRVVRREELAESDALHRAIRQSIDQGVPVLAANIIPPEDWGVITGYRRDRMWLCRSYNGGAEAADQTASGWPTAVVVLTVRLPPPSRARTHAESLHTAIELFGKRATGSYALGQKALDEWQQSLRSVRDRSYIHPNFWTYISLLDARAAAARYLRGIGAEFGTKGMHIGVAADFYEKEARILLEGLPNIPQERDYPASLPPVEMRNRQIEVLKQARALEEKAIEAIKKAL